MASDDIWILGITMTKFGKRPDDDVVGAGVVGTVVIGADGEEGPGPAGMVGRLPIIWTATTPSANAVRRFVGLFR